MRLDAYAGDGRGDDKRCKGARYGWYLKVPFLLMNHAAYNW
jgi:hypothetical protein